MNDDPTAADTSDLHSDGSPRPSDCACDECMNSERATVADLHADCRAALRAAETVRDQAISTLTELEDDYEWQRAELATARAVTPEAFSWAGEYGFGSPTAARRVWEAARLLRPDLEPNHVDG